ncbi:MAG TPA: superoxide dismutase family protein [Pseudoflavonifractor sp.]|nr:superoxide dismutase family protein [Pseudoflavonifractor sp.]
MRDHPCHMPRVLVEGQPAARALVRGSSAHPELLGEVLFYPFQGGSLLLVRVAGLPGDGFFGFHIHERGDCCDGGDEPFHCAGAHYNPADRQHPDHAGDLPVLLANDGLAYTIVYTGRFRPEEVVGRAVIIHDMPDDYRSQPAGDSGNRIGCGAIEEMP